MNFQRIADRYGVTLAEAELLRAHIDSKNFLDWSQASYAEVDAAMHHAGCAVLGKALTNPAGREKRRAGMAAFRGKMLASHKAMLAGGNANVGRNGDVGRAAREYHASAVATIERAQKQLGEV
jgi:hypothetical protein